MKPFLKLIVIIFIITFSIVTFQSYSKNNFIKEAEAHFQQHCDNDAGEFIYRTVDNVEGLFQMRPRDPRDYISRLRNGDLPEDPYGHTNSESQRPWEMFIVIPKNKYKFFETTKKPDLRGYELNIEHLKFSEKPVFTGEKYWVFKQSDTPYFTGKYFIYTEAKQSSELKSKYGFTWQEVQDELDKKFGIWGGELIIKNLKSDEILGVRRGYFHYDRFSKKISICPKKGYHPTYDFISKVLIPVKAATGGEG